MCQEDKRRRRDERQKQGDQWQHGKRQHNNQLEQMRCERDGEGLDGQKEPHKEERGEGNTTRGNTLGVGLGQMRGKCR